MKLHVFTQDFCGQAKCSGTLDLTLKALQQRQQQQKRAYIIFSCDVKPKGMSFTAALHTSCMQQAMSLMSLLQPEESHVSRRVRFKHLELRGTQCIMVNAVCLW